MLKKSIAFIDRDVLLHLRLPFSFFLLPIYCFAISQAAVIDIYNAFIIFIVLHFFIYPGSNLYNSYMDNDKGSIGGLRNPPPATRKLYYSSILFDLTGLLLCSLIGIKLVILIPNGVRTSTSRILDTDGDRVGL